ncbi:unnamed protein product [Schistosoma turkestanicum]|nr:unnamed protein product [Schistosoma turkestanicum]
MTCKEKPSKSILKSEQEKAPTLGTYNIYTKRASFKDDVILQQFIQDKCEPTTPTVIEATLPIAPDVTEEELTPEEISRRKEFKQKRRLVDLEGADGLNLKAVLAHRVCLPGMEGEDEAEVEVNDDDDDGKATTDQLFQQTNENILNESVCIKNNDDSLSFSSELSKHQTTRKSDQSDSYSEPKNISYPIPNLVNTLSTTTVDEQVPSKRINESK